MKPIRDAAEAAQALEATLLRQMLRDSKAFTGGSVAGGQLYADMFVDALADAVEKAGGIGLASLVEGSLPQASGAIEAGEKESSDAERASISTSSASGLIAERTRADLLIRRRPERSKGEGP